MIRDKIMPREPLAALLARERLVGRRVVFTNGCFDILHAGHALLLEAARETGDLLVVGLNSDSSVHGLKGDGRPVNPAEERALVLAALAAVDFVTVFDEPTPRELILALRPDVLVKGADWRGAVVGQEEVEGWGGEVIVIPLLPGRSTTAILERLGNLTRKEDPHGHGT